MAIQKINLGTAPNGVGGDTLRSTATKINENFSNAKHAASKLIGTGLDNVPIISARGIADTGIGGLVYTSTSDTTLDLLDTLTAKGGCFFRTSSFVNPLAYGYGNGVFVTGDDTFGGHVVSHTGEGIRFFTGLASQKANPIVYNVWTDRNATKDSNGFLKGSSPIVKVHADKVVLNDEAEDQNVTFKKNGIGDYTITTESGLSTDGWCLELPKDLNGNPKVAVTLSGVEGVITLKSYKRIFSMETFTFEPDLDNPLDIPTDRWIDIRLNEIPKEDIIPSETPYSEV